ncbi:MAG TPA: ABC transporter permease [Longimicrobiales bacterium]|nr:ABC transporter permease [Longimicrobiales bacterium]
MRSLMLLHMLFRRFRRHPLYSFACIGTLALAVATGTASMAVMKRAFLEPLPYPASDRLVSIYTETETWPLAPVSPHVMAELEEHGPIAGVVGIDPAGASYSTAESTEQIVSLLVTPDFFQTLGAPVLGRGWAEGATNVVVVSWPFWQEQLSGDPAAVGRSIIVDGTAHTVVGVLDRSFVAPYWPQAQVLRPADLPTMLATRPRGALDFTVIAVLDDGTTLDGLHAYLAAYSQRTAAAFPEAHSRQRWVATSLRDELVGSARPVLLGTAAAALLLLLIVCANIAGLSATLAVGARNQLAVQCALGATRWRLMREEVYRSALLAALGTGIGIWLAYSLVAALAAFQPEFLNRMGTVSLDAGTASIAFAIGVLAGIVSAVVPYSGVVAGRLDPLPGARGSSGGTELTLARSALVVAQVALALVLIVGAGLLVRTVRSLADTTLGFRTEGLYTLSTTMPVPRFAEEEAQLRFEQDALDELRRLPGVLDATASIGLPVVGGSRAGLTIVGRDGDDARGEVAYFSVAPGFMSLWGIAIREGRDFGSEDREGAIGAILINETASRTHWPDGDAVGARIWLGASGPEDGAEWMRVVGVVADVRQHGPAEAVLPTMYGSTRQFSWPNRSFTVRVAASAPPLTAETLRAAIHRADAGVPVGTIRRADEMVADATARHRLAMLALSFFGIVATVLSAFGLYAVVSLTSRLRRREYAIRLAVGAEPGNVRHMVIRQGMTLGALGVGAGVALAAAGTRALQGILLDISPLDITTFATAIAVVMSLAGAAAWGPARHAARTQPVEVLNSD